MTPALCCRVKRGCGLRVPWNFCTLLWLGPHFNTAAALWFTGHRWQVSIEPQMGLTYRLVETAQCGHTVHMWAHSSSGALCSPGRGHFAPRYHCLCARCTWISCWKSPLNEKVVSGVTVESFREFKRINMSPFCAYWGRFATLHPSCVIH